MTARLRHGVALDHHLALAVDRIRHECSGVLDRIGPRAVGRLAIEELTKQGERAAPEPDAQAAVRVDRRAIGSIVTGYVATGVHIQVRGEGPFLHNEVHDARDRVGAVLRRCAASHDLGPLHEHRRNQREVDGAALGLRHHSLRVDERQRSGAEERIEAAEVRELRTDVEIADADVRLGEERRGGCHAIVASPSGSVGL